jgi:hypothetical protein
MTARTAIAAVLLAAVTGCGADMRPPAAPRPVDARRSSPKELRETTAVNGILAGAEAGQRMLAPAPPAPPTPRDVIVIAPKPPAPPEAAVASVRPAAGRTPDPRTPAIKLAVRSQKPQPTEPRAVEDALQVARIELMKRLQELDPPVIAEPSMTAMRTEYLKRHTTVEPTDEMKAAWKADGLKGDRVWAEVDVEVSDAQVQKLRAGGRVTDGLRVAGLLFAVALAAHGFLRLDAWTKGYLTGWLAAAAVGLVAAAGLVALL